MMLLWMTGLQEQERGNKLAGRKQKKENGKFLAAVIGCMLLMETPAYAIPPYDNIPAGMSAERYNELQDGTVSWDELNDLVTYYNPTYTKLYDSAMTSVNDMENSYGGFVVDMKAQLDAVDETMSGLYDTQRKLNQMPAGSKVEMNGALLDRDEALAALKAGLAQAQAGRAQIKAGISKTQRSLARTPQSVEIRLYPVKNQMVSAMEGLMFSYASLDVNRSMVQEQVKLYQTIYETQQNLRAQNMATDAAVQAAKNNLDTAQKSLNDLSQSAAQLARAIGLQAGYGADKLPQIGEVPEPDLDFINSTDPVEDEKKAMEANSDVIAAGKAANGSQYAFQLRDMTENEAKGKLSAKMEALYASMKEKQALYETAKTQLERARLTKESAERKFALGMLGRADYESQQMAYISYEASAQLAKLNLSQAINTYQWAVKGVVSLD